MANERSLFWPGLLFALGTLVAGGARLSYDGSGGVALSDRSAAAVARCLPARQVAKDTTVTLVGPGQTIDPPPAATSELAFELEADAPLDPVLEPIRSSLAKMKGARLRRGTLVRVKSGRFVLERGSVVLRHEGSASLLSAPPRVSFKAAADTEYLVRLEPIDVAAPGADGRRILKAGARGVLSLGHAPASAGVSVVTVQPVAVQPWLAGQTRNVAPMRATGQKGLSDLTIDVRKAGVQFDAAGLSWASCVWRSAEGPYSLASVSSVKPGAAGSASLTLALAADAVPALSYPIAHQVRVAIATSDGRYHGFGTFAAVSRGVAALIALLWTGLALSAILAMRRQQLGRSKAQRWRDWSAGLFIGPDGQPSLALFQIFFWTTITVWGLAYVFIVTGSLLALTPGMLVLLGIAGAGTVAARFVSRPEAGSAPSTSATAQPANVDFSALLSTNGQFDLLKLQLLLFTVMIGLYVTWRIVDTGAFPELDANTLLLMGVSQGVYLGGKVASTTPLARAQALKIEIEAKKASVASLESEKKAIEDKGTAASAAEKARLAEIPGAGEKAKKEQAELQERYDAVLKELGLKS